MSTDFLKSLLNKVHLMDSLSLLKKIPDNTINLTLTSPPFYADDIYILENGNAEFGWSDYSEYLDHLLEVLFELYRITIDGGKLVLILTNTPILDSEENIVGSYPIIYDVYNMAEEIGWKYYTEYIWSKSAPSYPEEVLIFPCVPDSFPISHHDIICVFRKKGNPLNIGACKSSSSVWNFPAAGPIKEYNPVYHSFPNELVMRCIELYSMEHDLILDPYAGSGQVIRVATSMNRYGIGSEIDVQWKHLWKDINN